MIRLVIGGLGAAIVVAFVRDMIVNRGHDPGWTCPGCGTVFPDREAFAAHWCRHEGAHW